MKKVISIFFISVLALGIVGPVRAETSHGSGAGITQGTADGLYGSLAGEAAWAGTQDHTGSLLLAAVAAAANQVMTQGASDTRYPQLAAATNTFTGIHLVPDGVNTAPTYAFTTETGTGFYLAKAGRIGAAFGGVLVTTFDATKGIDTSGNVVFGDAAGDTAIFNGGSCDWTADPTTFGLAGDFNLTVVGQYLLTSDNNEVQGAEGWAYNPGDNIDTDIIRVEVTGSPKGSWDHSELRFSWTHGSIVPDIGIGTTPDADALFHAVSTTQVAIGDPVMTPTQRDLIASGTPPEGSWVFDSVNHVPNYFDDTGWRAVLNIAASSLTPGCVPFSDTAYSLADDAAFFWDNINKRLGIGTNTPDATLDVEGGAIAVSEIAAPGTPASGKFLLYAKTDGKIYSKNDAGTEVDLAGPTVKAGLKTSGSFAGNPQTVTVTFSTAFPDANYSVSISGTDVRDWSVDSQVAGSFVINANAAQALSGSAYWTAIAHYDP